ncbi:hypothetical protein KI387_018423, partial [Taxus chinensis]
EESDEEEGTQGYASRQSYAVFTRSQGKEVEVAAPSSEGQGRVQTHLQLLLKE